VLPLVMVSRHPSSTFVTLVACYSSDLAAVAVVIECMTLIHVCTVWSQLALTLHYSIYFRSVVKTKIQNNPQKYNKGMLTAAKDILKEDGPDALLGGLGPTIVGYGIEGYVGDLTFEMGE